MLEAEGCGQGQMLGHLPGHPALSARSPGSGATEPTGHNSGQPVDVSGQVGTARAPWGPTNDSLSDSLFLLILI